jgi:hypothetical protein
LGKSQRQKGARGELEFAALLRKHGFEARRHGRHFHDPEKHEHCDVEHNVPGIHFEVKRREKVDVWSWIDQADREKKEGEKSVVAFRKNRRKWHFLMDEETFFYLLSLSLKED